MNILSLTRQQIEDFVASGMMDKANLKHYDICKAMANGATQEKTAEIFGLTDDSYVRTIKRKKCPDCKNIH